MRTSYAAGRYKQMKDMAESNPFWMYCHGDSMKPRPEHLELDRMVLRHDDPWWDKNYPPNGWGCQCYVRCLTEGEVRRGGYSVVSGSDLPDAATDPRWQHAHGKGPLDGIPELGTAHPPEGPAQPDIESPRAKEMKEDDMHRMIEAVPENRAEEEAERAEREAENAIGQTGSAIRPVDEPPQPTPEPAQPPQAAEAPPSGNAQPSAAKTEEEIKAENEAREKDRAERAERIKKLEKDAEKQYEKARILDKEVQRLRDADPNSWIYDSNETRAVLKKANKAWDDADRAAVKAFGESALQEVLDATGKQFTNPLEAQKKRDEFAHFEHATRTIVLNLRDERKDERGKKVIKWDAMAWMGTSPFKCHDGGGFYVDRETLERVYISPREHLKMTLTHELAHDEYADHKSGFHETMHNLLSKVFPGHAKHLYVWSPPEDKDYPYEKWKDKPGLIDVAEWEKMKEEKTRK